MWACYDRIRVIEARIWENFFFHEFQACFCEEFIKKNFLTGFLISERTKKNFIFCVTSLMELLKKSENKNL